MPPGAQQPIRAPRRLYFSAGSSLRMLHRLILSLALLAGASVQPIPSQNAGQRLAQQPAQQTFHVQPLRPVSELRAEALKAQPPVEHGDFLNPDLVELIRLDPALKLDIRYASSNNFLGTPLYEEARAFLQRPAAEALVRADHKLHQQGYGLLIFDGYRPWYVTRIFWDATPPADHIYVADPAEGSRHNRGCAVDLTL